MYLCQLSFLPIIKGITSNTLEVEKDPIFEFWRQDLSPEFIGSLVVGFCNGLVLFYSSLSLHDGIRYIMINPLSKQCHELPPIKVPPGVQVLISSRESGGIDYDDYTNTFKIVSVIQDKYWSKQVDVKLRISVHVLGTDTWREISQVLSYFIEGECVFAHGCLYWLVDNALV
ncbi:hypothetical protein Tco_0527574 [Tanacetum coccineum]